VWGTVNPPYGLVYLLMLIVWAFELPSKERGDGQVWFMVWAIFGFDWTTF
jgi:hypothetical protein